MSTAFDQPLVKKLLSSVPAKVIDSPALEERWSGWSTSILDLSMDQLSVPLATLDAHLTLRAYIAGYHFSTADLITWATLRSNRFAHAIIKQGRRINLSRWFNFIESSAGLSDLAVHGASAAGVKKIATSTSADDQADTDLRFQNTGDKVVTRFPPEPSGFLHIGHAKAALLNSYFAHEKYKNGSLIIRFDDTNPAKEKQEFQDAIVEDLTTLGITADKVTHTSDYFQELHDTCIEMIKVGKAYADDIDRATLEVQRKERVPSQRRDASAEESLRHFADMRTGSTEGQRWFVRAKIAYDDVNGTLRDPVIYRCNTMAHHRTGTTWKVYPTYDFACPIIDAYEGVTHALRTTEYNDRDAQYQWMLQALNLRIVQNWNFGRLLFQYTPVSKRHLKYFVNNGLVSGWDDPRMPTVRGLRRRGLRMAAMHEFIISQGPSRNVVNQEWSAVWAINKAHIDPSAGRYTAIAKADAVICTILDVAASSKEQKPLHARHALGMKTVVYGPQVLLEQADAAVLQEGDEITLMNWGNAIVRRVQRSNALVSEVVFALNLAGDFKKTKKIHWLCTDQKLVDVVLYDFDDLITKVKLDKTDDPADFAKSPTEFRDQVVADLNVASLPQDAIIQFDRKAYYRVDRSWSAAQPAIMFRVPTGRA